MSKSGIPEELQQYLPKSRRERNREKAGRLLSRLVNPVIQPFKYAMRYENGAWKFGKLTEKPKKFRQTFADGTARWDLNGAGPLPMDENTIRRLIETPNESDGDAFNQKKRGKPRRYIPAGTSLEAFFDRLNEAGIRYAILRWFDKLPRVEPGEDIDMLVGDEVFSRLDEFFERKKTKGAIPCDIYTESGIPGTAFDGVPYYETRLAKQILDNTVTVSGRFKVPDPRHHFLSLAYHVAYHKAHASGLPYREGEPPLKTVRDHDYAAVLDELANDLGITFTPTLEAIHVIMQENGWMPAVDTVRKLSLKRPLLRRYLDDPSMKQSDGPNLCAFVVRDWAHKRDLVPWLAANIRNFGFDIKLIHELTAVERQRARASIRGGNWNRGPWPVSGGPPAAIIIAYDYTPEPPDSELIRKQPFAANARFVVLKKFLRDGINNNLPADLHVNAVHSADDDSEAWEYISATCPQMIGKIRQRIAAGYEGDPYLRLKLHQGKRATSYLVYRNGRPCVLKIFADSAEGQQCYQSERLASELYSEKPWAPGWLDFGPNWMLQKFHDQANRLDRLAVRMSGEEKRTIAARIVEMLRDIHDSGYAHRDVHAQNIFVEDDGISLIDFETLCEQQTSTGFARSYDITGKGLPTPFGTGRMGFDNPSNPRSLCNTLGVTAASILSA